MAQKRLAEINEVKKGLSGDMKNFSSEHLTFYCMDMSNFTEVIAVANQFTSEHKKLDVLLNNAGLIVTSDKKTFQGYRMTLAVNHLAHMLLTDELYSTLQATEKSRIINVSSMGHKGFPGSLNEKQTKINIKDIFDD